MPKQGTTATVNHGGKARRMAHNASRAHSWTDPATIIEHAYE